MAANLVLFLNSPEIDLAMRITYGALTGLWIFCGVTMVALFEHKSARYIFINGEYRFMALALMGAIIGAWS